MLVFEEGQLGYIDIGLWQGKGIRLWLHMALLAVVWIGGHCSQEGDATTTVFDTRWRRDSMHGGNGWAAWRWGGCSWTNQGGGVPRRLGLGWKNDGDGIVRALGTVAACNPKRNTNLKQVLLVAWVKWCYAWVSIYLCSSGSTRVVVLLLPLKSSVSAHKALLQFSSFKRLNW